MKTPYRTDRTISTIASTVVERYLLVEGTPVLRLTNSVVYIAASWQNRFRLREIRTRLADVGIVVNSQWIDFDREYTEGDFGEEADRDYSDIKAADFLILDTTDRATRGGREWEAGYATGLGKHIWRVGPVITPFHVRVQRAFVSGWGDCLEYLRIGKEHADARDN